jgi:hypothetical protein
MIFKNINFWTIFSSSAIVWSLSSGNASPLGANDLESNQLLGADLSAARESITIGSSRLRLTAYLWRDFMPMGVPDDSESSRAALAAARGMIAKIELSAEGDAPLPKSLHAEVVYVVQDDRIWQTRQIEERRDHSNCSSVDLVIRNGPQWKPSSFVDVFVRIADGTSIPQLLVVQHQVINRAE